MKVLLSNNENLLNAINTELTAQAGLPPGQGYSVGKVLAKHDGNGYWYDIEAAVNCSNKEDLKNLVQNYLDGNNLPNLVDLVIVEDLVEEGYKQGPDGE